MRVHRPFVTMFEALAELDMRKHWWVRFHLVHESLRVLGRPFRPRIVEAIAMPDTLCQIWRGTDKEKPARGSRQQRRQAQPAIEDAPGEGDHANAAADSASSDSEESLGDRGGSDSPSDPGDDGPSGDIDAILRLLEEIPAVPVAQDAPDVAAEAGPAPGHDEEGPGPDSSEDSSCLSSGDYASVASEDMAYADSDDGVGSGSLSSCGSEPPGVPGVPAGAAPARQESLSVYDGDFLFAEHCIKYNAVNDEFYAECPNPAHGSRCRATRSAHEGRKAAQGRPLGFLAAWVLEGLDPQYQTAQEHQRKCKPSHRRRRDARFALDKIGQVALLREFQAKERPRRDGEGLEPENVP